MFRIRALSISSAALLAASLLPAQQTPDESLHALQAGNRRYAEGKSVAQPVGEGVRRTLSRGQSPFAVVVTCSDSRVPPEHLFNVGLGELIVVRTAGHIATAETVAAIEQAVEQHNVPLCVVLGHERCDVVGAAIAQSDHKHQARSHYSAAMLDLLERIEPAVRKAAGRDLGGKLLHDACEEEHAQQTALECLRRSPLLRRYESVGRFRMVAARYHTDGHVEWLPHRDLPPQTEAAHSAPIGAVPMGLPPHVALSMLRAGHRRFLGDHRPMPDLSAERREALGHGEQPLAIVLTDTDSRVSPEHVFDAGLGELYVVRVAGYALTDEALASIEFAAGELGASLLLVMGHDRCEPIRAAADDPQNKSLTPNQRALLRRLEPTVAAARHGHARSVASMASRLQAQRTLDEARSRSALLRTLEQNGRFAMLPCFYDVGAGDLHWLEDSGVTARAEDVPPAEQGHGDAHAAANGHDAHGSHDEHGSHDPHDGHAPAADANGHDEHAVADHDAHGDAGHGDDELPVMELHAMPMGETAHDAHGSFDAHGSHGAGDPHGAHDSHDAGASHGSHDSHDAHESVDDGGHATTHGDAHAAHGDDANGHGHDAHGDHHGGDPHASDHGGGGDLLTKWLDPVVVVGMLGILSLLTAAVMAMKSRA